MMTKEEMQRLTMLEQANAIWDRKCTEIRENYQRLTTVLNDPSTTREQRVTAEKQIQTSRFLVGFAELLEMQAEKLIKMYKQPIG